MLWGQGHFGKVSLYCYDPTNDGTGEMVAVKALKAGGGPQLRTGWRREIDILRTLYHKHIVKYKGCCEDQGGRGSVGGASRAWPITASDWRTPSGGVVAPGLPASHLGPQLGPGRMGGTFGSVTRGRGDEV